VRESEVVRDDKMVVMWGRQKTVRSSDRADFSALGVLDRDVFDLWAWYQYPHEFGSVIGETMLFYR
jgi:hypothetical protein